MPCVIDSSVALGWALPDESSVFDLWLDRLRSDAGAVPAIWFAETSNGILAATRRRRIDQDQAARALQSLSDLSLVADHEGLAHAWRRTFELARTQDLTVYDASYVELAMRKDLPLLTLDAAMRRAAERLGVVVPAA